jgi:hypothetical protein
MESKKFQKNKEDFTCEKCAHEIIGNGYTNHCPKCLWSKHVDVNPGDRASVCGGQMEPVEVIKEGSDYSLLHKCLNCDHEKKNIVSVEDDFDNVVEITKEKE